MYIHLPVFCQRPFVRARQMPRICFVRFLPKSRNVEFCERPRNLDPLFRSLHGHSSQNPRCPFYIRPEIKGLFHSESRLMWSYLKRSIYWWLLSWTLIKRFQTSFGSKLELLYVCFLNLKLMRYLLQLSLSYLEQYMTSFAHLRLWKVHIYISESTFHTILRNFLRGSSTT